MRYDLALAGPEGAEAAAVPHGSEGAFYALGAEADEQLRRHPLAIAELGKPRGYDHIHLSIIDGTDFISWWGRRASGYHYQIGRMMRLIRLDDDSEFDTCIACAVPLKDGDMVYSDVNGGVIHAACCGPERECYAGNDGEPLKDGAPIPAPWAWHKEPQP